MLWYRLTATNNMGKDLKPLAIALAKLAKSTTSLVGGDAEEFDEAFAAELAAKTEIPATVVDVVDAGFDIARAIGDLFDNPKIGKLADDLQKTERDIAHAQYGSTIGDAITDFHDVKDLLAKAKTLNAQN